jgi:hypothetical protein
LGQKKEEKEEEEEKKINGFRALLPYGSKRITPSELLPPRDVRE